MTSLLLAVVIAFWGYGGSANSDPWILSTNQFIPNRYQNSPYVANGYFGQRLPAEGAGYWIYQDNSTGDYMLNCQCSDFALCGTILTSLVITQPGRWINRELHLELFLDFGTSSKTLRTPLCQTT